jgi:hypothetical protein
LPVCLPAKAGAAWAANIYTLAHNIKLLLKSSVKLTWERARARLGHNNLAADNRPRADRLGKKKEKGFIYVLHHKIVP